MTTVVTGSGGRLRTRDGSAPPPVSATWAEAVRGVLSSPGRVRLVFQPIVDLARGTVAGYEALARFPATAPVAGGLAPPDRWFTAADTLGLGAELEAVVIDRALRAATTAPGGRFVTVNVSPHLLHEDALEEVLFGHGRLDGVVLELTEHLPVRDLAGFTDVLARLRSTGASIALDDAGSGYSGLQQIAVVRPDIVKLDRALVDHADRDETKLALAELLGLYAGRLDACLLVEGVERVEELEAFQRLGVPLAQGWLFGAGTAGWAELDPAVAARIRELRDQTRRSEVVAGLVERAASVGAANGAGVAAALLEADPGLAFVVTTDQSSRPVSLVRRASRHWDGAGEAVESPVSLRVGPTAATAEVAARAMTRDRSARFDPVMCVDETGRLLGALTVERLVLRLAGLPAPDGGAPAVDREERPAARRALRVVR